MSWWNVFDEPYGQSIRLRKIKRACRRAPRLRLRLLPAALVSMTGPSTDGSHGTSRRLGAPSTPASQAAMPDDDVPHLADHIRARLSPSDPPPSMHTQHSLLMTILSAPSARHRINSASTSGVHGSSIPSSRVLHCSISPETHCCHYFSPSPRSTNHHHYLLDLRCIAMLRLPPNALPPAPALGGFHTPRGTPRPGRDLNPCLLANGAITPIQ